jgi:hypothetical protein
VTLEKITIEDLRPRIQPRRAPRASSAALRQPGSRTVNQKDEKRFRTQIAGMATELVAMKQRLFAAGLYRSGHLLDKVTTELGWEMAEHLTGKDPRK